MAKVGNIENPGLINRLIEGFGNRKPAQTPQQDQASTPGFDTNRAQAAAAALAKLTNSQPKSNISRGVLGQQPVAAPLNIPGLPDGLSAQAVLERLDEYGPSPELLKAALEA